MKQGLIVRRIVGVRGGLVYVRNIYNGLKTSGKNLMSRLHVKETVVSVD